MKTGIHIEPCNVASAEKHNTRSKDYLEKLDASGKKKYDIFRDETHLNSSWVNPEYEGRTLTQVLQDLKTMVKAKTGRSMQEKATPIREGVCPIKPDTTIEEFQPVIDWLASKGASVIRIDIHRDEGHIDAVTGERKHNYHAHVVIDFINHNTGKSVKLAKSDTSELQDILAEALTMERGVKASETGAKHLPSLEFREKKAAESVATLEKKEADLNAEIAQKESQIADLNTAENVERLKSSVSGFFADASEKLLGKGVIAEAHQERDAAIARAEKAEQIAKEATNAKKSAEADRDKAISEKNLHGSIQFFKGREAAENELKLKIEVLSENLEATTKERDKVKEELSNIIDWNPAMRNWEQSVTDMREAEMEDDQIEQVFRCGHLDNVEVKFSFEKKKRSKIATLVKLEVGKDKTRVLFDGKTIKAFVREAIDNLKERLGLNVSRGMKR